MVRHDCVLATLERGNSFDLQGIGAYAGDFRPEAVEHTAEVLYVRLGGGVVNSSLAFGEYRGKYRLLGAGYARFVEEDVGAAQVVGVHDILIALHLDGRA